MAMSFTADMVNVKHTGAHARTFFKDAIATVDLEGEHALAARALPARLERERALAAAIAADVSARRVRKLQKTWRDQIA